MDENYKLKINVRIGDRSYPMNVKPQEEQQFRKAAKDVSEIFNQYSKRVSDPIDRMAFVAFNIALKNNDPHLEEEVESAKEKLIEITKKVSSQL